MMDFQKFIRYCLDNNIRPVISYGHNGKSRLTREIAKIIADEEKNTVIIDVPYNRDISSFDSSCTGRLGHEKKGGE